MQVKNTINSDNIYIGRGCGMQKKEKKKPMHSLEFRKLANALELGAYS